MTPRRSELTFAAVIAASAVVAIVISLMITATPVTDAQEDPAPLLTFSNPAQGDVLGEPAEVLQLCFDSPISRLDEAQGGDYFFQLTPPGGSPLALRQAFEEEDYGIAIFPANQGATTTEGEWTLEYRVSSAETLTPSEGTLTWTVGAEGREAPQASPPPCQENGFTATPNPDAPETAPPSDETPEPTREPSATPDGAETDDDGDEDDPSVLDLALMTIGSAAVLGVILTVGFFVRRGIGYEPHRPGPEEDDAGHH